MNEQELAKLPEHIRERVNDMISAAQSARPYAIHHTRHVGAAVLTKQGHIYKGTNIKPVAGETPLRFCAEVNAATAALAHGELQDIIALLAISNLRTDRGEAHFKKPCDVCVEFFHTMFPERDLWVIMLSADTPEQEIRVAHLSDIERELEKEA